MPESPESANKAHWERVGASYRDEWEPPAKRALSHKELDFLARHFARAAPDAALDVGVGNGRILHRLLAESPSTRFYGLDVAESMLAACEARFRDEPRVRELRLCDISREPVPFDRRFGFISAVRVLKYSPAWAQSVARLAESLQPGGRLVFSMPNRRSVNRLSRAYAVPWYQASPQELQAVCEGAGLRVLETAGFARLPYVAYHRAGDGPAAKLVTGTEAGLSRLLGATALTRELFVAATTE